MKALILAAGYATRLYPLTKEYPKPLLPIGKRPMIDYIIDKLIPIAGLDEIIVVTNAKFFAQFENWAKGLKLKKRLSIIDDLTKDHTDRRGAIGDIDFVLKTKKITQDLLVVGGDNLFDESLEGFLSFAGQHNPSPVIGVYDIKDTKEAQKYGVIKLDADKKIVDFEEKPLEPKSTLVAMCLYYFPREKLGLIEEYLDNKESKHDATGFYIDWLRQKESVLGFVFDKRWYDIGHPNFYEEARQKFGGKEDKGVDLS